MKTMLFVSGTGPGVDLHFITTHWQALNPGTTALEIDVKTLVSVTSSDIGIPAGNNGSVTVQ